VSDGITGIVIAAALLSAVLHAAWNAAVKASPDPAGAMAAQVVASGLIAVPLLMLLPLPSLAAVPWLAGSSLFGFLTLLSLLRGYASPLLVLLLAYATQGEAVGTVGILGIALVSFGIAGFAYGEGRRRPEAFAYAVLAGVTSAVYAVCDANGARHSPSVAGYGFTAALVNAVVFGTFHRMRNGIALAQALRSHWGMATLGAGAASLSYILILWVWSHAPVALGAALRDTSVVFAALIAVALGERLTPQRLAAILLVAAGACLIRLA
jgi:drug/metabolite transporter (DMT)-like permease